MIRARIHLCLFMARELFHVSQMRRYARHAAFLSESEHVFTPFISIQLFIGAEKEEKL